MAENDRKIKIKNEKGEIEEIDASTLADGPILCTSLGDDLLLRIKVVYDKFKPYLKGKLNETLEQFEIGFMRDAHPEAEVELWEDMAITFDVMKEIYNNDESINLHIYDCLIMNALGAFTPEEENTEFVKQLKQLYARVVKTRKDMNDDEIET